MNTQIAVWPLNQAEQDATMDALAAAQLIVRDGTMPGLGHIAAQRRDLQTQITNGRIPLGVDTAAARTLLRRFGVPELPAKLPPA